MRCGFESTSVQSRRLDNTTNLVSADAAGPQAHPYSPHSGQYCACLYQKQFLKAGHKVHSCRAVFIVSGVCCKKGIDCAPVFGHEGARSHTNAFLGFKSERRCSVLKMQQSTPPDHKVVRESAPKVVVEVFFYWSRMRSRPSLGMIHHGYKCCKRRKVRTKELDELTFVVALELKICQCGYASKQQVQRGEPDVAISLHRHKPIKGFQHDKLES